MILKMLNNQDSQGTMQSEEKPVVYVVDSFKNGPNDTHLSVCTLTCNPLPLGVSGPSDF